MNNPLCVLGSFFKSKYLLVCILAFIPAEQLTASESIRYDELSYIHLLIDELDSEDDASMNKAIQNLQDLIKNDVLLDELLMQYSLSNEKTRLNVLEVLSDSISDTRVIIFLELLCKDETIDIKIKLSQIFGRIDSITNLYTLKMYSSLLIELSDDDDATVRWWACKSLGRYNCSDNIYNRLLNVYFCDSDVEVRIEALEALAIICPSEDIVPIVMDALNNENRQIQILATDVIKWTGYYPE